MIGSILRRVWDFICAVLPYGYVFVLSFVLVRGEIAQLQQTQALKAEIEEMELNQENEYVDILTVDEALADADVFIANDLKKLKNDSIKQNADLVKTIYAVDKNSNVRDQGIVDGVNKVVDGVNSALQKPSYEYLKSITVRLIGKSVDPDALPGHRGWMGTGVIIGFDKNYTYVLTNRHVVDEYGDGKYNYYVSDEGKKYPVTAIKISKDDNVDLALVRFSGRIESKHCVVGFADIKPQDPVYMVGMDLGRPFFYSEGTVAGFDPDSSDELVVGLPVGPGNSGSGAIDRNGNLVGLLYAGSIIDQEGISEMDIAHGLCVPIKAIRLFLAGYIDE